MEGLAAALGVALFPVTARGQEIFRFPDRPMGGDGQGWVAFTDGWYMLNILIVLGVTVLLAAALAYHPLVRGKAASVEELEQPKTFIMYSIVGAMAALVSRENQAIGLVIFGIGGLLRFRTNVGAAKDTGRVILATIVGVSCGCNLFVAAVSATAFGWSLIWYLESQNIHRLVVKGLAPASIPRAVDAYRQILTQEGCRILGEKKKIMKGQVSFVIKTSRPLDREAMEDKIDVKVPEELRGSLDWEVS
jgi:hypothetical protein